MTAEERRAVLQRAHQAARQALESLATMLPEGFEFTVRVTLKGNAPTDSRLANEDWDIILNHLAWKSQAREVFEILRSRENAPTSLLDLTGILKRRLPFDYLSSLGSRLPSGYKMPVVERARGTGGWQRSKRQIVKVVS